MKKIEYSRLVIRKLKSLQSELSLQYGDGKAKTIIQTMLEKVTNTLRQFEKSGINISHAYGIDTDYWYIFTNHNYFVYRIESEKVVIVQMFHEREDFIMKLFGMSGRTQESIDYWGE